MTKKQASSPLESAKVSKEAPKRTGWPKGKDPAKAPKKDAEAPGNKAKDEPTTSEVPSDPAVAACRFKVMKKITLSMNGSITTLNKEKVIVSQHYGGMPGIEKLKAMGVELEKLD